MLTASVVICAYTEDRWPLLLRSVESALHQKSEPLEVIVCIDHNDALLERCRREWPPGLRERPIPVVVVANKFGGRLGSARNSAAEVTRGEIVVFLDDDAWASSDWLDRLLEPYEDGRVIAVGGAPIPDFEESRPPWFPIEFDWVFGCAYEGLPKSRSTQPRLIGANMSVRREALAKIGGFHSDNHDDMDMCHRLVHSFPDDCIVYEPTAQVRHHVPRTRTTWQYFWRRCFYVNKGKVEAFHQMEEAATMAADIGFVRRALTRGVPRALGQAVRGDPWGAARAGAILAGIALAGAGNLAGRGALMARRRRSGREPGS
jgi:glucosyl-dolichyl phosphate glucuronosyltransferase